MQRLKVPGKLLWNGDDAITCAEVGLDSDFTHLVDAVCEEMFKQAVRAEGGGLKMLGYGTASEYSLFLVNDLGKPPEYWIALGSRLFGSCGFPTSPLELHPLDLDLLRVLVPYERSRSAAPHKKQDLLLKTKRLFQRTNQFTNIKQALRDCGLIDCDEMLADFQNL